MEHGGILMTIRLLKQKIQDSIGLKFVAVLAVVVSMLMIMGTIFVARMLMAGQYRAVESHGLELGHFLGKAGTDAIVTKNSGTIEGLVFDAVRSRDMLYIYIQDGSGAVLNNSFTSFNRERQEIKALLSNEKSEDVAALAAKVKETLDALEVSADINYQGAKIGRVVMGFSRSRIKTDAWNIVALLLGTSVGIVLALSAVVYVMARKMIAVPAAEAEAVAWNISEGNLTQSVRVRSMDEFGMLGRGLNRMVVGLKGMIGSVRDAAIHVGSMAGQVKGISEKITSGSRQQSEAVEEAASSVNEMHFALKEIAGNVENLYTSSEHTSSSVLEMAASVDEVAKTMSELTTSIEDTSTAITQMSAAVKQTAENVEILSSAAEETAASANEMSASVREVESNARQSASLAEAVAADAQQLGMRSIEKTIDGMKRIEAATRHTAGVVSRLRERSESIGGILTVIEDVTDQTGLLALNAAILAAQAGEHGKGFAVVAAEIRELANRTASSTQEIGKLIAAVQEESQEAAEAMAGGLAVVEEGAKLSQDAGDALRKILERADQSRDMSKSISRAAGEQTRAMKQVSDAVEKINEMTHQIAKATHEQKSGNEQITKAAEKMREITRFVKSATSEQAKGSKGITAAVEEINIKVGMVNRAATEVRAGSDLIVQAIDQIKAIAKVNAGLALGLNDTVEIMASLSESLTKGVEKFKI
jgi:methyl-accepting chemotaxis protein